MAIPPRGRQPGALIWERAKEATSCLNPSALECYRPFTSAECFQTGVKIKRPIRRNFVPDRVMSPLLLCKANIVTAQKMSCQVPLAPSVGFPTILPLTVRIIATVFEAAKAWDGSSFHCRISVQEKMKIRQRTREGYL